MINMRMWAIALMAIGFTLILSGMALIAYTEHANGSTDMG